MSLFPAYAKTIRKNEDSDKNVEELAAGPSWLSCSSFSAPEKFPPVKEKRKKDKDKKAAKKARLEESDSNLFFQDTGQEKPKTYAVPQVQLTKPRTSLNYYKAQNTVKKKKKKDLSKKRYFERKNEELNKVTSSLVSQEEFAKKTAEFNKILRDEPDNVKVWLEYVRYQDCGEGSVLGRGEKKLSILTKAIERNRTSEELLEEQMYIMDKLYPYDKVAEEAKKILNKYPESRAGQKWLVASVQYNLARMTTPGVLEAYANVLQRIHRLESNFIIEVILECGLFMRQAGLWEQLFSFVQMYLEMVFIRAGQGAFKVNVEIPESEIQALEDKVVCSGLTLTELWLRVEHLRTGLHFLPFEGDMPDDPQRTVLPEDLSHLLYPLAKSASTRLITAVLIILKIPPLPCTDSFYDYVGLKSIPWSLESAEILMTPACNSYGLSQNDEKYIELMKELVLSPQYLVERIGNVQYLEAVDAMFRCLLENCEYDKEALYVWQIRWWRYVVKIRECSSKQYESRAKKLLKEFRDWLPLYIEFALFQEDLGNYDVAIKVLETAIDLKDSPLTLNEKEKFDMCALYRTYAEILLRKDFEGNREKVLKTLTALVFAERPKNITQLSEKLINKASERFNTLTTEFLSNAVKNLETEEENEEKEKLELSHVMLRPLAISWIANHILFLYALGKGSPNEALVVIEREINKLTPKISSELTRLKCIVEGLYEILIDLLSHSSSNSFQYQKLHDALTKAVTLFPNNTRFLSIAAGSKLSGMKWIKMSSQVMESGSQLASVFLLVVHRLCIILENQQNVTKESAYNMMKSQLVKMISSPSLERCPMIWNLMLQCSSLVSQSFLKKSYYQAIEKCPWVKALYYQAGKLLPADLPEIQDLLVEKELRLHITPEELEILREDGDPIGSKEGVKTDEVDNREEESEDAAVSNTDE